MKEVEILFVSYHDFLDVHDVPERWTGFGQMPSSGAAEVL
jgi:hypothetical protein